MKGYEVNDSEFLDTSKEALSKPAESSQPATVGQAPSGTFNSQFIIDPSPVKSTPKPSFSNQLKSKATSLTVGATVALGAIVGASFGAGIGIAAFAGLSRPAPVVVNNTSSVGWVTGAAAFASPSVVTISVSAGDGSGAGSGSGVVLTESGYILTNTHVVTLDGATASPRVEVRTSDDRVFNATVIGTDPTNDLAVIKVTSAAKLTPATFADSNKINVGDGVVAIGAPLGLEATVTSGIVSALNRTIQVSNSAAPDTTNGGGGLQLWTQGNSGSAVSLSVVQTDAAINPGNSGGALTDSKGQIIGINVAIATASESSGGQAGSIGVGFAIPSNIALRIGQEIMKTGKASHAMLGAMVSDSTNSNAANSFSVGAKIEQLTVNGPAEKAGLKVGDIVIGVNGRQINSATDLTSMIRQQRAGATVSIQLKRDGQTLTISVKLGDAVNLK
jgi:putative serine protease PepD